MVKEANAILECNLFIECPKCEREIDLFQSPYDDDGEFSFQIFNNKWGELENKYIACDKCNTKFKIKSVEM